jgi:hypothetical protein
MIKSAFAAAATAFCLLSAAGAHAGCSTTKFLELPVDMQSLQPIATVTLNGKDTRVMLDTGAFYSVLYPDIVKQLALPQHDIPNGFRLQGIGGSESAGEATVQDFGIGKAMPRTSCSRTASTFPIACARSISPTTADRYST